MITMYHRPNNLQEAQALLNRPGVTTLPLGGGSRLVRSAAASAEAVEVVDLQGLGLTQLRLEGQLLEAGACIPLQALYDWDGWPDGLREAVRLTLAQEAPENTRTTATLGGTIVSAGGRSPFVTALLALDARLNWASEADAQPLGDYLALRGPASLTPNTPARLLVGVNIALNAHLRYDQVARSPRDLPIVCAAGAVWPSGRARLTLGGWGPAPILAFDGSEAVGADLAARSAYLSASDEWASAEYRAQMAAILAGRVLVGEPETL